MEKISLDSNSMPGHVYGRTNQIKEVKDMSLLTHVFMKRCTMCSIMLMKSSGEAMAYSSIIVRCINDAKLILYKLD